MIDLSISCYQWLLCFSVFFGNPSQINNISPSGAGELFNQSVAQGWQEYTQGFKEVCPHTQNSNKGRQKCYQRARLRLREWLNKETATCLKVIIPKHIPLNINSCHPAADAVFTYIVNYQESQGQKM